ncbi:MAG: HD domain-containing protein [Desulfuromonadaceae bacterium]|nr:HD domain-containing protein [Desulfuromonadaceae bacterium]
MPIEYTFVPLDSIDIEIFPAIPLYVKQGNNFILYKSSEVQLTHLDVSRLQGNKVEFLYVRGEDSEILQSYLENNIVQILSNEELSQKSRNSIVFPMLLNYTSELFKEPEKFPSLEKCRNLLRYLAANMSDRYEMLDMLSKIAQHDVYLLSHSVQTAILSMYMHRILFNADMDETLNVGLGGIFHDIGMLKLSAEILENADTLSDHEYARLKYHPGYSRDTLLKMGVTDSIPLAIALSHHERYNGIGYPSKLYGDEIPRCALVAGICDVYCTMTTDRPYRSASTPDETIKMMKGEKALFHPDIFAEFCDLISEY